MQELERALTIVRRKYEDSISGGNPSKKDTAGFLTSADEEPLDSLPAVRRKLQQAQVCVLHVITLYYTITALYYTCILVHLKYHVVDKHDMMYFALVMSWL
jgi:hypothetical protein